MWRMKEVRHQALFEISRVSKRYVLMMSCFEVGMRTGFSGITSSRWVTYQHGWAT